LTAHQADSVKVDLGPQAGKAEERMAVFANSGVEGVLHAHAAQVVEFLLACPVNNPAPAELLKLLFHN